MAFKQWKEYVFWRVEEFRYYCLEYVALQHTSWLFCVIIGMDLEMLQQCLLNEVHIRNIKLMVIALEHIANRSSNTKYTEFCQKSNKIPLEIDG